MISRSQAVHVALMVVVPAGTIAAQVQHQHGGKPPEQLGRVEFPSSCSPTVQPQVERGVALLHSFWYEEAGKTFKALAAADSTCPFAYWGQAMSILHPLWEPPRGAEYQEGLAAAERAVRLSAPDSRERAYAGAILAYYRDYGSVDHRTRLRAYETAMERLTQQHPEDQEGQIFLALALIANGYQDVADTTFARQRRAGERLEPLFEKNPEHPGLAHYLIHAYDYPPLATRAAAAADRYARIAPSVPHAHHMPSHIYTRRGQWEQSIASNLRSAEAARTFEQQEKLNAFWDQHGHALDYLAYAYLQEAKDVEAKRVVEQAAAVTAVFPPNALPNDYALAAIPARYTLERGQWADARRLPVRRAPAWPVGEAITHFAHALGAAKLGDRVAGRAEVDTLAQIEAELAQRGGPQTEWSVQTRIMRVSATAWLAFAEGDSAEALRLAAEAADLDDRTEKHPVTPGAVLPARELYGDLLIELGRPAEARAAYEASLARQPNRARSLFGAARSGELAGNIGYAKARYGELLRLWANANGERPELIQARRAVVEP